jgi:hypothetical protein
MLGISIALVACTTLVGCADGGRFAGLQSCSGDGSVVWWEYPNKAGTYEGINNNTENCGRRG